MRRSWAGPAFVYSYHDSGTNDRNVEQNFGVVHYNYSPKPAYRASSEPPRRPASPFTIKPFFEWPNRTALATLGWGLGPSSFRCDVTADVGAGR